MWPCPSKRRPANERCAHPDPHARGIPRTPPTRRRGGYLFPARDPFCAPLVPMLIWPLSRHGTPIRREILEDSPMQSGVNLHQRSLSIDVPAGFSRATSRERSLAARTCVSTSAIHDTRAAIRTPWASRDTNGSCHAGQAFRGNRAKHEHSHATVHPSRLLREVRGARSTTKEETLTSTAVPRRCANTPGRGQALQGGRDTRKPRENHVPAHQGADRRGLPMTSEDRPLLQLPAHWRTSPPSRRWTSWRRR